MARYRGPREKLERRLNADLGLKGERRLAGKSALEKRPYGPGQHGQSRPSKPSNYGIQLQAKQKLKAYYGNINERQFRNVYRKAIQKKGNTTENLVGFLESRLDTVVYRAKFATTVFSARQLINHGHIKVNGKKVNRPSYLVKPGDVIEVKEKSRDIPQIKEGMELAQRRGIPSWLELDPENFKGIVKAEPTREEIEIPIEEHLIVELYSK